MPVLRAVKRRLPQAQIYWWIEASLAPLFEGDPDLSGLFIFRRKGWRTFAWWREVWTTVRSVRHHRFDYVLDLQGLSRSGFFSWLANGKTTVGLDNDREGNREGAQIFYDLLAPRSAPGTPPAVRYLGALEPLGMPVSWDFEWLPQRPVAAATVGEQIGAFISNSALATRHPSLIALLPGARWPNKRWPVEFFAQTVNRLCEANKNTLFAVLGVAADGPLAELISRQHSDRCLNLTGKTSLSEMIEWLRRADLVISNDTGPMHVAAALNRPVLAIYGPSDPLYTGPHQQASNVLQAKHLPCVPCMKQTCSYHEPLACMRAITPEQICSRALSMLSTARPAALTP
jgi:lipopolysaccharide heptosyltransferase II